jgi:hypothetical protein
MPRFVGEKIDVVTGGEVKQPVALTWRKQDYAVAEVISSWFDWGFSAATKQKDWRTRRHRNYFRLRMASGEIFEIYLDRPPASAEGEWVLYQVLDTLDSR